MTLFLLSSFFFLSSFFLSSFLSFNSFSFAGEEYKESGWRLPRDKATPDVPRCTDQLASIPAADLTVENFTKYAKALAPLVVVDSTAGWELAKSFRKKTLLEIAGYAGCFPPPSFFSSSHFQSLGRRWYNMSADRLSRAAGGGGGGGLIRKNRKNRKLTAGA